MIKVAFPVKQGFETTQICRFVLPYDNRWVMEEQTGEFN